MKHRQLLRDLGIPSGYGIDPELPQYAEATDLELVEPSITGRPERLAPQTASAWADMKRAAKNDAIELMIVSGFRSIPYQVELFRKKLASGQGIMTILEVNAAPGYSQHHTGMAIDIATPGSRPLTENFAASPAFEWLQLHAGRFGFRMPYDRGNRFDICYEPWHWSQLGG